MIDMIRRAVIMSKAKRSKKAGKKSLQPKKTKVKNSASKNLKKRIWKHQGR